MDSEKDFIRNKLNDLCSSRGTTLAQACKSSGVVYKTLHGQLSNNRAIPFESLDRLAAYFDVPLSYFSIFSKNEESKLWSEWLTPYENVHDGTKLTGRGFEVGTDAVLDWIREEKLDISSYQAIRDQVDIFGPVGESNVILKVSWAGRGGFIRSILELDDKEQFSEVLNQLEPRFKEWLVQTLERAGRYCYVVTDAEIDTWLNARKISKRFRLIASRLADGTTSHILVYARELRG